MCIHGIKSSSNFGSINDHNLLGYMAEAVMIAWDDITHKMLSPTLGEVNSEMIKRIENFCQLRQICPGEYRMGKYRIKEEYLIQTLRRRHLQVMNA